MHDEAVVAIEAVVAALYLGFKVLPYASDIMERLGKVNPNAAIAPGNCTKETDNNKICSVLGSGPIDYRLTN